MGSTQKSYLSAKKWYLPFSSSNDFPPLPASECLLGRFISSLVNENLCHTTIKCYLAGVRHLHVAQGYGDSHISTMARLTGIRSTPARGPKRTLRLPITPPLLLKLRGVWLNAKKGAGLDDGAGCGPLFAFLRVGEKTVPLNDTYDEKAYLSFAVVAVDSRANPKSLKVMIKASITDPFRICLLYTSPSPRDS